MSDLCNHDLLERCVEGTCTPEETARMDAHVVECRTCADERTWLRRERALFRDHAASDHAARGTDDLWAGIEAELAPAPVRAPVRRRASRGWGGGLVAAAAAVLLLVKVTPSMHPGHIQVKPATPTVAGAMMPAKAERDDPAFVHDWTFPTLPNVRLEVVGVAGTITVHGEPGLAVRVHATSEALPDGWRVDAKQVGNRIVVTSECTKQQCDESPEVDLAVQLPMGDAMPVRIRSVSASVEARDVAGPLSVDTVSGDVGIERSAVRLVHTVSGDVDLDLGATTALDLATTSGELKWAGMCSVGCALVAHTVSGDVTLAPGKTSDYRATTKSVSGAISGARHHGSRGSIVVTTVSGDVSFEAEDSTAEGSTAEDER